MNPGDRVSHATFGTGTIIEVNDQHTLVVFDQGGPGTFACGDVALTPSDVPAPLPPELAGLPRSTRPPLPAGFRRATTNAGDTHVHQQTIVRKTDLSGDLPDEKITS